MSLAHSYAQLCKFDLSGMDGREDEAVEAAQRVLDFPGGALVLGGHIIDRDPEIVTSRVVSYVLRNAAIQETWPAWVLLLMPPYSLDATVLLNTLSAQRLVADWNQPEARVIASLLPNFTVHCLQQASLVAERAVSFAVTVVSSAWRQATPDGSKTLLIALKNAILSINDKSLQRSWLAEFEALRRELDGFAETDRLDLSELQAQLRRGYKKVAGKRPQQMANELVERVGAYLSSGAEGRIKPVQRVYLQSAHPFTGEVWTVIRSWGQFFQDMAERAWSVDVNLEPANVATGSLIVDHVVNMAGENGSIFLQIIERLDAAFSGESSDDDVGSVFRLLQALQGMDISLDVRHYWGRLATPVASLSRREIPKLRGWAAARLVHKIDSLEVPQADTLEKVFEVVDLSVSGREITPETLDVGDRQVNYYRRAAKVLGLLDEDSDLTPAGWQLARLKDDERWAAAVVFFEASACGSAWIDWSKGHNLLDIKPTTAVKFLWERAVGLSGKTLTRRAQTLKAWWHALAPYHYGKKSY